MAFDPNSNFEVANNVCNVGSPWTPAVVGADMQTHFHREKGSSRYIQNNEISRQTHWRYAHVRCRNIRMQRCEKDMEKVKCTTVGLETRIHQGMGP